MKIKIRATIIAGVMISGALAGCATLDSGYHAARTLVLKHNFQTEYIKTDLCTLTALHNFQKPGAALTVYIEGDGLAWRSRNQLSADPTPLEPLVLSLAIMDPAKNVAYLARPGQLTLAGKPDCDPAYWSQKRFSPEVISAIDSALGRLKEESRAKEINLIGYSGGAAIAVILAAGRDDVASLRTIAGNLDQAAVASYHNVTALEGSLNPIDFADRVSHIAQRHFIAAHDEIIPFYVTESFATRIGDATDASITIVEKTTHQRGWGRVWPALLEIPLYAGLKKN
ncbi:MAG: alpha/beta hydrolase [Candidatus Omnitrophica bacterium]|nr:alpha/beta hydrolase [Candidatus Omnitrophota bacterium]MDD5653343.1 alpha/beta hydrolase [Candidatus Omnitrophota bacterium]